MNNEPDFDDEFDADFDGEDANDGPEESQYDGPSKSQRKRDAEALQKLGEELIALKSTDLAQFDLPENLINAIQQARRITSHGGLKRQRQSQA
jgi:ribosome-associated protein